MKIDQRDSLAFLRSLGSVESLQRDAQEGVGQATPLLFNCHIHLPPNFSAFESVEQAVDLARDQGVKVLGASNYYDFSVYEPFVSQTQTAGIFPLFGTEIIALERDLMAQGIRLNDPANPGKVYICGKGITQFQVLSERAEALLQTIRRNDVKRIATMVQKMADVFKAGGLDTGLTVERIVDRVAARHGCDRDTITLQERHVAQAFQEVTSELCKKDPDSARWHAVLGTTPRSARDDAVGLQTEIRSHLMKSGKPCFVPEDFLTLAQARELINALGGIVCYPVLADGVDPICEYEKDADTLVDHLQTERISMVEFIPLRNQPDCLEEYVTRIRAAGIAVVAGTEHNTLALDPIDPACVGAAPLPDTVRSIFWEGTCVLAAHQFLGAQGESGFTDGQGQPNIQYASAEERIAAFAALGRTVMARYFAPGQPTDTLRKAAN